MLKVTFLKHQGGIYRAMGGGLTWNELDGWTMEPFAGDDQGRESGGALHCPADWQVVSVEETRCPECGERESCPAYETGVLYPCPYYESVTQKRSPDPLAAGGDCVTEGEE